MSTGTRKNKIGRNEPCPCGSGKKYKRCCLQSPEPTTTLSRSSDTASTKDRGRIFQARLEDDSGWPLHRVAFSEGAARELARGGRLAHTEIHPWTVAHLREWVAKLGGEIGRAITIDRMRGMATEEITAALEQLGVATDSESFTVAAKSSASAWELSEGWAERVPMADATFLGLAACELWRRWLPESPSLEMLDERMQEGYDALDAGDGARACRIWLGFGDELLRRLPEDLAIFEDADALFPGLNSLHNWCGDFYVELHNASLRDRALQRDALALFERLVERFAPSTEQERFRRELAEYALRCGDPERAESILRALIDEAPDDAAVYALLSDQLVYRKQPERARELLEQALRRPVRNASDWSLRARLDSLR